MQVRLLGPVDVASAAGPLEVSGLRRKAILAVLALHAGEVVSVDRLVDLVWGERAPATASNTVQSHVSALRRALGVKAAIVSRARGYVLDLPGEATDVVTAERVIRLARDTPDPARRSHALRSVLGLWRGRPLCDVTDVPFLAGQADRLDTLELEARRSLIDAQLALGEHVELIDELRRLAAENPFDERLRGQLILALYRAGRQADALAVLRDMRTLLAAELAVDPGPALRELEARILRHDAVLMPRPPSVALRSAPVRHVRSQDRAPADVLADALSAASAGRARLIGVPGDPGTGKTRLLSRLAASATRAGWSVLWGAGSELESAVPYGLFTNALDDHLAAAGAEYLHPLQAPDSDAQTEAYRIKRAVRTLLTASAQPPGLLLVLDDVHWADDASIGLLDHLVRNPPSGPVLVAVGYRPRLIDPRLQHALAGAVERGHTRLLTLTQHATPVPGPRRAGPRTDAPGVPSGVGQAM